MAVEDLGAKAIAESGARRVPQSYVRSEEDRLSGSDTSFGEEIPVIDLKCFSEAGFSKDEQDLIVDQVAQACQQFGFFQVINHGVPETTVSKFFQAGESFFNLEPEEKLKYGADSRWKHLTSDPYGLFAYGVTFQGSGGNKAHDWRDWAKFELHLANQHDAFPSPSFKEAAVDYENGVTKLFVLVMGILSQGLELEKDHLLGQFGEKHHGFVVLNYYPPCPSPDLVACLSPHSDPLAVTLLAQQQVQALEVLYKDKWIPVKLVSNAFVVNLGDLMQIFTNGKYKSPNHRVRASDKQRMSAATFFGPALACPVAPISQLLSNQKPPRYRSCITADYIDHFYKLKLQGKSCLDYLSI